MVTYWIVDTIKRNFQVQRQRAIDVPITTRLHTGEK